MSLLKISQLQKEVAFDRNQHSYEQLFVCFYNVLHRFANSIVHHTELAEEIVSDVMLKVWTMNEKLAAVENLKIFLYTAVRHTALNALEKNAKYCRWEELNEGCAAVMCCSNTPEEIALKTEWKIYLQKAVQNLPEKCRMVYQLVREEGCSYKEVAAIMSISENTVDRHLSNAVKKIVSTLKVYFYQATPPQKKTVQAMGSWFQMPVLEGVIASNKIAWKGSYT